MKATKKETPKREEPVRLVDGLPPGTLVYWSTLAGVYYIGRLKEWDNGTAIVTMADGREKAV